MNKQQKHDLITHLLIFAIVTIGLLLFDFFDNGTLKWSLWPIGGWLIGLVIHAVFAWRSK